MIDERAVAQLLHFTVAVKLLQCSNKINMHVSKHSYLERTAFRQTDKGIPLMHIAYFFKRREAAAGKRCLSRRLHIGTS
jgi:hypothetical protein